MQTSSSGNNKNNRSMYVIALLVVTAGLVTYFLIKPVKSPEILTQNKPLDIPHTKQGELLFIGQVTSDTLATIDIEVADNDQKRARGLMFRKSIPENGGMLFIHDYEQIQSFWMKNTYIPLDMLFISSNKVIVTIHHNTSPMKEWNYASTEPALYVVEVNAGFCNRHNIQVGDKIEYRLGNNSFQK